MSYRPHGRAEVNASQPAAWGVCDSCGFLYNHHQLRWRRDWRGPQIQNLRYLVCESCLDAYQQNGQRTFILPPDPIPIQNARPEYYVPDNNPLSGLGANPNPFRWKYSNQIGTMINAAGIPAAFDGNANKPSFLCAQIATSKSSYQNYIGINWSGNANSIAAPSSLKAPVLTHTLSSYTITGPNDTAIGSTAYVVQGANVDTSWTAWTTLASGSISGTVGETLSGTPTGGRFPFHRVAFYGGSGSISIAQISLSVADGSSI